jgi:hypothetical protein
MTPQDMTALLLTAWAWPLSADPVFATATAFLAAYATALVVGTRFLMVPGESHVLPIDPPIADASRPPLVRFSRLVPAVALAIALLCAESLLLSFYLPELLPAAICAPRWLLPTDCMIDAPAAAIARHMPYVALGLCAVFSLLLSRYMKRRTFYPIGQLLLGFWSFGALTDIIASPIEPARSDILFGAISAVQITAHAALALSICLAPSVRPSRMLRVIAIHLATSCVRLLGAVSMAILWPMLPPATAITAVVCAFLIPGLAAGVSIVATAGMKD